MHNNYYFLRQLTPRLSERIGEGQLLEAFSQNRDELILGFATAGSRHDSLYIKAHLDAAFCCLQFPEDFHRAKKNSVDLFPTIIGARVQGIRQFENERSFGFRLQREGEPEHLLLFKMHGNRANVVLFCDQQVTEVFKSSLSKDAELSLSQLDRTLDATYAHFEQAAGQASALYPTLGKVPKLYLREQGYDALSRPQQWEVLQKTIRHLEQPEEYFVTELEGELHLSLLPGGAIQDEFSDPIEALNVFFLKYMKEGHLRTLRKQLNQRLAKEQKQTESYLQKTEQRLQQLTTGLSHQQTADLIMANMHAIESNVAQVTLYDFYHQQDVTIRLNPKLTPQKNAENYYRKAKNQKIEVAQARQHIQQREERLLTILSHQEAIKTLDTPRALQEYADAHGLLQTSVRQEASLPYRRTHIDGYEVFIGKSAKSNDTLLREHARKDDLWLHAKDVSGSHVLIKQAGNKPFPQPVIEQAARLAAYYSKRKSDSLAPVIYTPCKYVRKGKNMPAGAVRVEREAVILVEPQALQDH